MAKKLLLTLFIISPQLHLIKPLTSLCSAKKKANAVMMALAPFNPTSQRIIQRLVKCVAASHSHLKWLRHLMGCQYSVHNVRF